MSVNPKSLQNLNPRNRKGIPNRATRDLKRTLDESLFDRPEYWASVVQRIEAGDAPALECLLIQLRYGRPRTPDDDAGETRREVIIRIPRPPVELEGRTVEFDDGSRRIVRLDHASRDLSEDEDEQ